MTSKGVVAVEALDRRYRGTIASGRWTLCLGAGLSRGLAPTWFDLTLEIVNHAFGASLNSAAFEALVNSSGWSLDAWIQAAANEYTTSGRSLDDFNDLLEAVLYREVRKAATGLSVERHLMRVLNNPTTAERRHVLQVCEFLEATYKTSSLLALVRILIQAAYADQKPNAIITFNADTFLETFIYLFLRRDHYNGPPPHSHPHYHYRTVSRPSYFANHRAQGTTSIFHCHGTIMPNEGSGTAPKDTRDRLVFLEAEYLRIAGTMASWPETLFLYHAQSTKMVFVGLSMADANIRRWLSATELELDAERDLISSGRRINPAHLWLTTRQADPVMNRIKLVSLLHLGVRPALIDSWHDLEPAMRNLLGL
ncbi:SIR2 family protein [Bradyrhizobium mercantei]|uniref:SIR2 family protein n=1 Tax=Bradyrhizobium mercantei TaxID=1904807 RepID=UPI00117766CE|nr:SIR2 family protein [Bradyrhizobium mercantei]